MVASPVNVHRMLRANPLFFTNQFEIALSMGMASAMAVEPKRNEELPMPNSKVTGGSGNTDKGSLITYSGGARG